ncbi:MAG: NAD(P)/FAD-dependent oxidoreductase [Devosia sp.]
MATPQQNIGHAPSYYAATANDRAARPQLQGEMDADVCIIGAGFTGISAGLELAGRGFSVVVLEAARIGFGASGRNGGQIVNGYSRDLSVIERRHGAERARALGAMSLEGGNIIRDRVAKYAIDCDLRPGNFLAAFTQRQMLEIEETRRVWEKHGHTGLEMVDRAGLARIVDTDRYVGGIVDHLGGHLHPLNLVLGEAAALESLGGRIFEQSPAIAVETGPSPTVRTRDGLVRAQYVLVCGNAYLGKLLPEIGGKIMPVSSQIIATEPLDPALTRALLPADYCVEDANYVLDYFRRTADNRLLYGGGVGYGGSDPASIEGAVRPHMLKTFPRLADARIEFAWSGNFALTLTRIPHVGRLSPTVYFAHGDSGHGVTTTHLLGQILGEAVAGHAERFDVWASLPYYPFPGGHAFSVPLTIIGSWWYRMRDRLGI